MTPEAVSSRFPPIGDGSGFEPGERFYLEELQLAFRNRGMPQEALRYPITPTGMHYLLIHFDVPEVDAATWTLEVQGSVSKLLSLTLDEIRQRPSRTIAVTMECTGNGRALMTPRPISQPWLVDAVGTAEWTGVPLREVLDEAGVRDEAAEILFTGLDRGVQGDEVQAYQRSLTIDEATRPEVLLAYLMNGEPLQPQHGYPLRLIVPGWYGMTSVKWLDRLEAIDQPFHGYQQSAYRYKQTEDDSGEPVTLIRVRALMVPPGIPDFVTRTRLVEAGPILLSGRAWAGRADVARVEVSDDEGARWSEATLGEQVSPHAWRAWSFPWEARPGRYALCVRATDADGNVQPLDPQWNVYGMGNNVVQRVKLVVE